MRKPDMYYNPYYTFDLNKTQYNKKCIPNTKNMQYLLTNPPSPTTSSSTRYTFHPPKTYSHLKQNNRFVK